MDPQTHPNHSTALCGTGALLGWQSETKTLTVLPLFCHSWACPRCSLEKAALWKSVAIRGKAERFLTLTYRPGSLDTPFLIATKLKRAFAKLVMRIRRSFGSCEYLLVWELTRKNIPHAHVLLRSAFIPQDWLSSNWHQLTGSYITDIRKVRSPRDVAAHMMKYLGKSCSRTYGALSPLRIVQKSKNWVLQSDVSEAAQVIADPHPGITWVHTTAPVSKVLEAIEELPVVGRRLDGASLTFVFAPECSDDLFDRLLWSLLPAPLASPYFKSAPPPQLDSDIELSPRKADGGRTDLLQELIPESSPPNQSAQPPWSWDY